MICHVTEESYGTYHHPDVHLFGMCREMEPPEGETTSENLLEMVADHEHKTITLRYAAGFKREMITLPYSGFMAFRAMMEMAMDDLWQGMTEDEREKARFEFNRRKR